MKALVLLLISLAFQADPVKDGDLPAFSGRWYGEATFNDGQLLPTLVDAEFLDGDWVVRFTQLSENRKHQPILQTSVEENRVFIRPNVGDQFQAWIGELDQSGSTYRGAITVQGQKIGTFDLSRIPRVSSLPGSHRWVGSVIVPGRDFEQIRLQLVQSADGWIGEVDLPERQCSGHPAIVQENEASLLIEVPEKSPIKLKLITPRPLGAEDAPRQVLAAWEEAGTTSTFILQQQQGDKPLDLSRPQDPVGPVPYEVRQEVIAHPIGHSIGATLTVPVGADTHPAVVLVPGDGGRDRDDRADGHRYQAVWADALARRGIASLRFDDRGVGSTNLPEGMIASDLTGKDVVIDTRHLVEWLGQQPGVDGSKIGVLGWDRGGLVCMQVAMGLYREVSFVVLLSTPGLPGIDMDRASMQRRLADVPVPQERIHDLLVAHGTVLDVCMDPVASDKEIRQVVVRYLDALGRLPTGESKEVPEELIQKEMRQFASENYRRSLRFDPRQILPRLRCPVLAVGGSEDLETPVELSLPYIRAAVERTSGEIDIAEIKDVNHRLQPVNSSKPRNSAYIRATVDPRALRIVTDWILEVTTPVLPVEPVNTP
ncbi:MAG: alpha/beta hydrolase [Phycisphaerales bacterium]|nr:alpha/beta hydrolase [Phycisphaerales bacterium]